MRKGGCATRALQFNGLSTAIPWHASVIRYSLQPARAPRSNPNPADGPMRRVPIRWQTSRSRTACRSAKCHPRESSQGTSRHHVARRSIHSKYKRTVRPQARTAQPGCPMTSDGAQPLAQGEPPTSKSDAKGRQVGQVPFTAPTLCIAGVQPPVCCCVPILRLLPAAAPSVANLFGRYYASTLTEQI